MISYFILVLALLNWNHGIFSFKTHTAVTYITHQRRRNHFSLYPLSSGTYTSSSFLRSKFPSLTISSHLNDYLEEEKGVPRLHFDLNGLIRWITKEGGIFEAEVQRGDEGWSLISNRNVEIGDILLSIPKSLCICANPKTMKQHTLLDNTQLLMNSLNPKQWRARLAVALLSERVRPNSYFRPYLRNLPFEFWGVPVFYSTKEFR